MPQTISLSQSQKLLQQQKLSPQQIQAMKLLEMPTIELEERIQQELTANPALEEVGENYGEDTIDTELDNDLNNDIDNDIDSDIDQDDTFDAETDYDSDYSDQPRTEADSYRDLQEADMQSYFSDDDDDTPSTSSDDINYSTADRYLSYSYPVPNGSNSDEHNEMPIVDNITFQEYLQQQLGMLPLSEHQMEVAEYVIGNLDEDGYLRRSPETMVDDLLFKGKDDVTDQDMIDAIHTIQRLEPAGVAAKNLQECLLLQLRQKPQTPAVKHATAIVTRQFNELTHKHYDRIRARQNINEDELKDALSEIGHLNPKPASNWNTDIYQHNATAIIPDFYVTNRNGHWDIRLNNEHIPTLRINPDYKKWATNYKENKATLPRSEKEAGQFAQECVGSAESFIKNITDRTNNLLNTMRAIVEAQAPFFVDGDRSLLRPMVLKDIAEKVDLDVSTISRISRSKYVRTDFGVFPLKFFFSESMTNDEGEQISTRTIKQILKDTIGNEDKKAPMNDDQLVELLKQKGFPIARRTVAKYREQLGIPVARLRKEI